MSIKNNTTQLQDLLAKVNALPEAGGVELPELSNEGTATELFSGKQLIDSNGNIVEGSFTIENEINTQADLVAQIQTALQGKAIEGGNTEQATPVIAVNSSNGLITATAGSKSSTYQLAFQTAKTITPGTTTQVAVSSGYYTGGNITVAAVPTQSKSITPKATTQNVTPDSGKFLSKVTVAGDANLVASNIKNGVSIFGVSGTLEEGGDIKLQNKTFTENGTYTADSGYDGLGSVTVNVEGGDVDHSGEDTLVTRNFTMYANDRVTTIGNYAFYNCTSLTSVSFPNATTIGGNTFCRCFKLTSVSFPLVTTISDYAFQYCSSLTSVSFPNATTIDKYAFVDCSKLTSVSFPLVTTIDFSAFGNCPKLTTASFPQAATIGMYAFCNCSSLTTANFPLATSISGSAFQSCSRLTSVSFPNATTIGSYAFSSCWSLTSVSFPNATAIGSYAFSRCYNLKSLYLTGSSLCTLNHSNAFTSTPIGGYSASTGTFGSIYVPASLVDAYKSATNWTYFSSRFVGI